MELGEKCCERNLFQRLEKITGKLIKDLEAAKEQVERVNPSLVNAVTKKTTEAK